MADFRQRSLGFTAHDDGVDESEALRLELGKLAGVDHRKFNADAMAGAGKQASGPAAADAKRAPAAALVDLRKFAEAHGLLPDDFEAQSEKQQRLRDKALMDFDDTAIVTRRTTAELAQAKALPPRAAVSAPTPSARPGSAARRRLEDDARHRPPRRSPDKASPGMQAADRRAPPVPVRKRADRRLLKAVAHARSLPRLSPPKALATPARAPKPLKAPLFGGAGESLLRVAASRPCDARSRAATAPRAGAFLSSPALLSCPLYSWPTTAAAAPRSLQSQDDIAVARPAPADDDDDDDDETEGTYSDGSAEDDDEPTMDDGPNDRLGLYS